MSLVVSDSGPLHYLILCDAVHVLPQLYGTVIIPPAVAEELQHARAPVTVSKWIRSLPPWVRIAPVAAVDFDDRLGNGERQAIELARQLHATQLLVDDRLARKVALERRISVTGTIGIIEKAAGRNLLVLADTLRKLLQTNFRVDSSVISELIERQKVRQRRTQQ